MARKKRSRTKKKKSRKKQKSASPVNSKIFLTALATVMIIGGFTYGAYYFFAKSDFFKIERIEIERDLKNHFSAASRKLNRNYKGRNIFSAELDQIAGMLEREYPHVNRVEVRRVMPDSISVNFIMRRAIAYVEAGGGFVIDRESVVLPQSMNVKNLVKIRGLGFLFSAPSVGEKVHSRQLAKAVLLVEALKEKNIFNRYEIDFIDISDGNNLVLNVEGMEIKMGVKAFPSKIEKLRQILNDPTIRPKHINYVDLRFEEAIIAPRS